MNKLDPVDREFRDDISQEEAAERRNSIIARMKALASLDESEMTGSDEPLRALRALLACYYLKYNGDKFSHSSVVLPLSHDVLEVAIATNVEGAFYEVYGGQQGRENAHRMLQMMCFYSGEDGEYKFGMTKLGLEMMDELMMSLCNIARDAIDRTGSVNAKSVGMGAMQ